MVIRGSWTPVHVRLLMHSQPRLRAAQGIVCQFVPALAVPLADVAQRSIAGSSQLQRM